MCLSSKLSEEDERNTGLVVANIPFLSQDNSIQ